MKFQNMLITKVVVIMTLCLQGLIIVRPTSLTTECSTAIQQVTSCLEFATGKAADPTKSCCNAVSSMKDKQPVCLCFFIGQAHNGSEEIKSLGIQEAKLLQLPSACHLTNSSIAECPKLLGISPSSPAAAIFLHNNMTTPTGSATPLSSSASTATPTGDNSRALKHHFEILGGVFAVFVSAILLSGI